VAASLAARDGLDPARALALWEQYTRAAFAASRGWSRVLVDYAELIADPLGGARRLLAELAALGIEGLRTPVDAVVRDWLEPPASHGRGSTGAIRLGPSQQTLWAAIADRSILDDGAAAPAAWLPERVGGAG
jgi:hypothetical protein